MFAFFAFSLYPFIYLCVFLFIPSFVRYCTGGQFVPLNVGWMQCAGIRTSWHIHTHLYHIYLFRLAASRLSIHSTFIHLLKTTWFTSSCAYYRLHYDWTRNKPAQKAVDAVRVGAQELDRVLLKCKQLPSRIPEAFQQLWLSLAIENVATAKSSLLADDGEFEKFEKLLNCTKDKTHKTDQNF